MPPTYSQETIDAARAAIMNPMGGGNLPLALRKDITQATGLVWYDLRKPALLLYPFLASMTPLRNRIPRNDGEGGTAIHWKGVTGINTQNAGIGVSEGNRGAKVRTTTADYLAAYAGLGYEDAVTWEAKYAGKNFEDVKALAALNLLRAFFLAEEPVLLYGNATVLLGQTPTPTVAAAASTGNFVNGTTYSVICVALTPEGRASYSSVVNGVAQVITKTNADGSTDTFGAGSAKKSASGTVLTGGGGANYVITATVAVVPGAAAYAWFIGTVGNEQLCQITTINSVSQATIPTGQLASTLDALDHSINGLLFNGVQTFATQAANGGYVAAQPTGTAGTGTPLTSDGEGGIVELTAAFRFYYDNWRMSPGRIIISSQEVDNIRKKIVNSGNASILRMVQAQGAAKTDVVGGVNIIGVLNPYTQEVVPFEIHPNAVPGTILFDRDEIPYPGANTGVVKEVELRQDYYQIDWPWTKRNFQMGVYADEVLKVNAPFVLGSISNIANG